MTVWQRMAGAFVSNSVLQAHGNSPPFTAVPPRR